MELHLDWILSPFEAVGTTAKVAIRCGIANGSDWYGTGSGSDLLPIGLMQRVVVITRLSHQANIQLTPSLVLRYF